MADTPPGSWPTAEDDSPISDKDGDSLYTAESQEHSDDLGIALEEEDNAIEGKGKGKGTEDAGKHVIARMPELPPEIRETILYLIDPETFASLVLVNQAWREASQTPHLYAHHLSRCPSFSRSHSVIGGPFTEESLPQLKRQFAREVKRNLFEAYLQPRRTNISLISTSTSSSAAFPRGEAFDFSFSPNGHWVLALSSSRIYVIDTVSPTISVQRELKVLRRPLAASILDDGSTLAVYSNDHQVNIYSLTGLQTKHLRSVFLDHLPHAIALSPKGEVLAAAFDGGIEVHSLATNALETDHRAIKCDRVDTLKFSSDGSMLLGTTKNSKNPYTVILSAPYYTDDHQDLPASEQISHLWTSQILFPNSSRDCSNATLLPARSDGDANWTFVYDKVFESFRAVRTDDLRNGTTYFTGPKQPRRDGTHMPRKKLMPCTTPSSSDRGELVAAGFLGTDVWLYGLPEGLDLPQNDEIGSQSGSSAGPSTPSSGLRSPARSFTRGEATELARLPKWQVLVDKYRNVFAKGRRIAEISGVSGVCWISHGVETQSLAERLIITAPGGISSDSEMEQDEFASVDGGRIVILDFDRKVADGVVDNVTFEVGQEKPELLEEESMDMDTEVALARRRTVKRDISTGATVADVLASAPPLPPMPALPPTANAIANSNSSAARVTRPPTASTANEQHQAGRESPGEGLSLEEASEIFGGSYSHTQPRSRTSLYRSATAVAANRQRNPTTPRIVEQASIQFRRPGDRTELPHESDADNWVPPPPAYTAEPDRPLPEELRMTLLPRNTEPPRRSRIAWERPRRSSTVYGSPVSSESERRISSLPDRPTMPSRQRSADATSPSAHNQRSMSESFSARSGAVSPLSTVNSTLGDEPSESSTTTRRPSTASSGRRPMSALVGSITTSLRRPHTSRLSSPISAGPNFPQRPSTAVSFLPSATSNESPVSLTGANLQQRLEYPLPPAPTNSSMESLSRRFNPSSTPQPVQPRSEPSAYQEMNSISPTLPSAQQLTNLNNRARQAPPLPSATRIPSNIPSPSGYPIPAPPRGALGAAGNNSSPSAGPLYSPTRSLSNRNSFARSSPALLRPSPQRLDTIESISSIVSRSRTRSKSRDLHTAGSGGHRKSRSVGPALRWDRVMSEEEQQQRQQGRRGLFGGRKGWKGKGRAGSMGVVEGLERGEGDERRKCVIM